MSLVSVASMWRAPTIYRPSCILYTWINSSASIHETLSLALPPSLLFCTTVSVSLRLKVWPSIQYVQNMNGGSSGGSDSASVMIMIHEQTHTHAHAHKMLGHACKYLLRSVNRFSVNSIHSPESSFHLQSISFGLPMLMRYAHCIHIFTAMSICNILTHKHESSSS